MCQQETLVKLQAQDTGRSISLPCSAKWYALLFHRLIDAIPPGLVKSVQSLVSRGMDEYGPVFACVAWLPHTHHLFPDSFKVRVCVFLPFDSMANRAFSMRRVA